MSEAGSNGKGLTRSETITALTHYYRAEVQRSLAWRERLDRTTNWAVAASAAFLGFGFSHPGLPHTFFAFGLAIIYILLFVESRRYRFYDAYEYRVRLLNQYFIYGVLARGELTDPQETDSGTYWRAELASDLRYPQYKMGVPYALGRRLRANYGYIFAVLLAGWLMKIKLHPVSARSWRQFFDNAAIGVWPGYLTLFFMLFFAVHLLLLIYFTRREEGGREVIGASRGRRR